MPCGECTRSVALIEGPHVLVCSGTIKEYVTVPASIPSARVTTVASVAARCGGLRSLPSCPPHPGADTRRCVLLSQGTESASLSGLSPPLTFPSPCAYCPLPMSNQPQPNGRQAGETLPLRTLPSKPTNMPHHDTLRPTQGCSPCTMKHVCATGARVPA
jgi:hypothetical protein